MPNRRGRRDSYRNGKNENKSELTPTPETLSKSPILRFLSNLSHKLHDLIAKKVTYTLFVNLMICGVFFLILSICLGIFTNSLGTTNTSSVKKFEQSLRKVQSRYHNQNEESWQIIRSAIKPIIEESQPDQPAVILFFGIDSAANTIDCLVKQIVNIINTSLNVTKSITLQGSEYEKTEPNKAKELIDEELKHGFENMGKVAVFYNINKVPTEAMRILHSYCDNDNAPFKDRVILLTVLAHRNHFKDKLFNFNSLDVEKYLENIWSDKFQIDDISPLLSRVGNSIVIINSEPSKIIQC